MIEQAVGPGGLRTSRSGGIEISVVLPCLNEARTLEACIVKARAAMDGMRASGEVIVADNGSTDGSQRIAESAGATVVHVASKGYGSALMGGIAAARGRYVVMGDADSSYDFGDIPVLLEKLREGYDLVVGNRFQGGIMPGAMPWLHRWIGNPVLSRLGRLLFPSCIGDFHCGLRGFRKDAYRRMKLQSTGMEFASEMIIRSTLLGMRIGEVPTVLRPDGRMRRPHLRSFHDGWRHLRLMLLFRPEWMLLLPGVVLFVLGLAGGLWLFGGPRRVFAVTFDIHTLLVSGFFCLLGFQFVVSALFAKAFAVIEGLHPPSPSLSRLGSFVTLEAGIAAGALLFLGGFAFLASAFWRWRETGYGGLDPFETMREVIPAVVLMSLGAQAIFASFFLGILGIGPHSRR